jgi:hypothetical protein
MGVTVIATKKLCGTKVLIRLGGLNKNLTNKLRKRIGLDVEVEYECLNHLKTKGEVLLTRFLFLHLRRRKKVVMLPLTSINKVTHQWKTIFEK